MLDRTIAPALQELTHISLPQADVESFPNGARVHYLPSPAPEVIRFEIVFPAGKWYESAKGVSYFASKLLLEGTRNKTAKQIAEILDFYGASLECNQGFDWATLTFYSLSKYFAELFPLIKEILEEATFPEPEFKLLKTRTRQNIQVERKKPAYLASELFTKNIFGADHPYISGLTEAEIEAIDLEQVKTFYQENYTVSASEIFVCGAISEQTKHIIKDWLGSIQQKQESAKKGYIHSQKPANSYAALPIPGSMQAAIRIGRLFPLISEADYLKLTVLNKILGGYFGSRLMKNIREDKGLTYGIYSTLSVRKHATLFFIGSDVNTDKADLAIEEIYKELTRLKESEVPADELNTVRNYMVGKFLNESTTVFDQTDRYKHIILHNLPSDHFDSYINTIRKITTSELKSLAENYFKDMTTIKVG